MVQRNASAVSTLLRGIALLGLLQGACMDGESYEGDEQLGKSWQALAYPGRWQIPADILAIGDTQNNISYTGAGPWIGPEGCSPGMRPGTDELRMYIDEYFPQVSDLGGYNCRPIVGNSSQTSVHSTGRALDIHIPLTAEGEADNDLGDPIAHWLIANAEHIGIQFIIWDRSSWAPNRPVGERERAYTGQHPHHDHLHIELSVDGGERGTPWFSEEHRPPDLADCQPLPAEGGIIDEMDGCAQVMGPSQYWRFVQGSGYGESLFWTNAFQGESHSNWVRWNLELEAEDRYEVEVYLEPAFSVYQEARYELTHAGEKTKIVLDQSSAEGWHSLGVYEFAAGGEQELALFDNNAGMVAEEQHIVADAIRLTPSTEEPEPEPEPKIDEGGVDGGCSTGGGSGSPLLLLMAMMALLQRRRLR